MRNLTDVELCSSCHRRAPARGYVCENCRQWMATTLAGLPRRIANLQISLVREPATGDRVCTSRTALPLPTSLAVLNAVGPGSEYVTIRDLPTQEYVGTDQHGQLPPAVWLDVVARAWRRRFGDIAHTPNSDLDHQRLVAHAQARQAYLSAVRRKTNTTLGIQGWQPSRQRPADPLQDEWEARFGPAVASAGVIDDIRYLIDALPLACDDPDCGIGDVAGELRALSAELSHVLRERPDDEWIGRCPVMFTDRHTGEQTVCGAAIWQDPYVRVIECPRCRTEWGRTAATELLELAVQIRQVWPLDRRRRYSTDDLVKLPPCPTCRHPLCINWREVTERADTRRWWRIDKAGCVNNCSAAGRVVV